MENVVNSNRRQTAHLIATMTGKNLLDRATFSVRRIDVVLKAVTSTPGINGDLEQHPQNAYF